MRILIVDDEMPARRQLQALIKEYGRIPLTIEEANSGEMALNQLKKEAFDVVFLDIHLQDLTGLDIAEEMIKRGYSSKIVFVTAYDDYALRAFEYFAVDYLLKPIEEERFKKTLQRLEGEFENNRQRQRENSLSTVEKLIKEHLKEEHQSRKLTLERDDRHYVVDIKEILYVETEVGNTIVRTKKGDFCSNLTLTEWEGKLPDPPFFKTHRSFLVNLEEIQEVLHWFNNSLQLKMEENSEKMVPVSRSNTKRFKEKMNI